MNRYDLVMFDMDGTFMVSKHFHYEVFYRFFNEHVMPVTREQVEHGLGTTVREIFDYVGVPEEQMESCFCKLDTFCRTQVDELAAQIPAVEGIHELLAGLRQKGIKRALLTNSMETVTDRMLVMHDLNTCFEAISGADFYSLDKCERSKNMEEGIEPSRILYVGDAEKDVELGNKMGYDSCFVKTKYSWYKDAEYIEQVLKPTYTVTSLGDILNYV